MKIELKPREPSPIIASLKCFVTVDAMIREGKYLREVLIFIRQEKEWKEITDAAALLILKQHRDMIFSGDEVIDIVTGDVTVINDDNPYYVMNTLQSLIHKQVARIDMETDIEKKLGKALSNTHKEMQVAGNLAQIWLKVCKETNSGPFDTRRPSGQSSIISGGAGRLDLANIAANPESRQKILSMVDKLIQNPDVLNNLNDPIIALKEEEIKQKKNNIKKEKVEEIVREPKRKGRPKGSVNKRKKFIHVNKK